MRLRRSRRSMRWLEKKTNNSNNDDDDDAVDDNRNNYDLLAWLLR